MPMVVEALQKADEANTLQTIQPHVDYCSITFTFSIQTFCKVHGSSSSSQAKSLQNYTSFI